MTPVVRIVEVTKEDIVQGCREDSENCPVARATLRTFPEFSGISVYEQEVVADYLGWTRKNPLPEEVTKRIRGYDQGEAMQPFSFELKVDI